MWSEDLVLRIQLQLSTEMEAETLDHYIILWKLALRTFQLRVMTSAKRSFYGKEKKERQIIQTLD